MAKRNRSKLGQESKSRFGRTGLLGVAVLAVMLSSGCQQVAGAVAQSVARGVARSVARGVAHSVARGVAHSVARGVARSMVRGAAHSIVRSVAHSMVRGAAHSIVRGAARSVLPINARYVEQDTAESALSKNSYETSRRYLPMKLVPNSRVYQLGFSNALPPDSGWRLSKMTKVKLLLVKNSMTTSQGFHTFQMTTRIRIRGRYSSDLKVLQRQRRENIMRYIKRARYSDLKMKNAIVTLDDAGCVFSRAKSTDTGVQGYKGKKYTLYVDEVICIHPNHPKLLVSLTYAERVPPNVKRSRSPIKHMARSLRFYTVD